MYPGLFQLCHGYCQIRTKVSQMLINSFIFHTLVNTLLRDLFVLYCVTNAVNSDPHLWFIYGLGSEDFKNKGIFYKGRVHKLKKSSLGGSPEGSLNNLKKNHHGLNTLGII